jgi:hypothetical protein
MIKKTSHTSLNISVSNYYEIMNCFTDIYISFLDKSCFTYSLFKALYYFINFSDLNNLNITKISELNKPLNISTGIPVCKSIAKYPLS